MTIRSDPSSDQKKATLADYCRVAAEVAFELKQDAVGGLLVTALNRLNRLEDEERLPEIVHH